MDNGIAAWILKKLLRHGYVGKKHTPADNVPKGIARSEWKRAKTALKELIKLDWIKTKPTYHGMDISINQEKIKEIKEFILKQYGTESDS